MVIRPSQVSSSGSSGHTVVRFFSISTIAGALGDVGQNFKNIANILDAMVQKPMSILLKKKVFGCGSFTSAP